jgi:hypothetical protein
MTRVRQLLMLALLATAVVLSDQLIRLFALSSTAKTADDESSDDDQQLRGLFPSSIRMMTITTTTDEMNDVRRTYGEDGVVVVVDPASLSDDGNATMINSQEEDDDDDDDDDGDDDEAKAEEWKPLPWSLPSNRITRKSGATPQQSSVDFMNELDILKRRLNISLPWWDDHRSSSSSSSLPTPIIALNLPKSATLTLYEYFNCGGYVSAHTFVNRSIRVGEWRRAPLAVFLRSMFLRTAIYHPCILYFHYFVCVNCAPRGFVIPRRLHAR